MEHRTIFCEVATAFGGQLRTYGLSCNSMQEGDPGDRASYAEVNHTNTQAYPRTASQT